MSARTRRRYRRRLAQIRWRKPKPQRWANRHRRVIPAPPAEPRAPWRSTLPRQFSTKVVGVTFADGYPTSLYQLEEEYAARYLASIAGPIMADLVRDPDNEHDPNAIRVEVRETVRGIASAGHVIGHIGHIGRGLAARLAPEMDRGERWEAQVQEVLVHSDNPANPGIAILLHRVGETPAAREEVRA